MGSVWFQGPERQGQGTHVLVVATSKYKFLPADGSRGTLGLRQLTSGVLGAYRLALWMREHALSFTPPIETIRLALSPSDVELKEIDNIGKRGEWVPASSAEVRRQLFDWQEVSQGKAGNVAMLYVAGHGILSPRGSANVLLDDVFEFPNLDGAISVHHIQAALGVGHLAASLVFVDACQDLLPDDTYDMDGGVKLDPPRNAQGDSRVSRPIYFGSAPATQAFGEDGVGSYLSRALLECLQGRAARATDSAWTDWVVDTTQLGIELAARTSHYDSRQRVEPGGVNVPFVFYRMSQPPELPLTVQVRPTEFAAAARGELFDRDGNPLAGVTIAWSVPVLVSSGQYTLSIDTDDPPQFRGRPFPVFHAPPDGYANELDLS